MNANRAAALQKLADALGKTAASAGTGSFERVEEEGASARMAESAVTCTEESSEHTASTDFRLPGAKISMGNQLMEQFEPWYFGVAYAFCFFILHGHARHAGLCEKASLSKV